MSDEISTIRSLRPAVKSLVIDLVTEAGIDTKEWRESSAGARNGAYCYNWSFVDRDQVVVLCLWHQELIWESGEVMQRLNYKKYSHTGTNGVRNKRANMMDQALQIALTRGLPVRVVIVDGVRRDESDEQSSKVARRMLDPKPWAVVSYDEDSGECQLIRDRKPVVYVDQHSLAEQKTPERHLVQNYAFKRSIGVRQRVLRRSSGLCEFCHSPGFHMPDGRIYIETHHITPLSEGGTDTVSNIVALCANHHREAHHGQRQEELRNRFREIATPQSD